MDNRVDSDRGQPELPPKGRSNETGKASKWEKICGHEQLRMSKSYSGWRHVFNRLEEAKRPTIVWELRSLYPTRSYLGIRYSGCSKDYSVVSFNPYQVSRSNKRLLQELNTAAFPRSRQAGCIKPALGVLRAELKRGIALQRHPCSRASLWLLIKRRTPVLNSER